MEKVNLTVFKTCIFLYVKNLIFLSNFIRNSFKSFILASSKDG